METFSIDLYGPGASPGNTLKPTGLWKAVSKAGHVEEEFVRQCAFSAAHGDRMDRSLGE